MLRILTMLGDFDKGMDLLQNKMRSKPIFKQQTSITTVCRQQIISPMYALALPSVINIRCVTPFIFW